MANVTVIGAQWGDEGKGKIVDWLSERASVVVRFQGGHNAGHTLVINGQVFKLSLLPSGIVRAGKMAVIGSGVVIDPWALLAEIDRLQKQGVVISPENLMIAENACLILPIHQALDQAREIARGKEKIGTTGRGIGPAYEDKTGRRAVRLCDLTDHDYLRRILGNLLDLHNSFLGQQGIEALPLEPMLASLIEIGEILLPFCQPVWRYLNQAARRGERILFEGAQGVMLDVDYGTYPFVTSSNTVAGQASSGSGLGPRRLGYGLGIVKAYTTRVGSGPFPTELTDEIGQGLGQRGHEFGTVTGRKRRCGWFDAAMTRQTLQISGIDGIALTKLDVLDGMKSLSIGVGYQIDGKFYDYLPASTAAQAKAIPVFETLDGWQESTRGARRYADLPPAAIKYIRRIEELIETPVAILSTSPEREDTILLRDPFDD